MALSADYKQALHEYLNALFPDIEPKKEPIPAVEVKKIPKYTGKITKPPDELIFGTYEDYLSYKEAYLSSKKPHRIN